MAAAVIDLEHPAVTSTSAAIGVVAEIRQQLTFMTDPGQLGDLAIALSELTMALDGARAQVAAQAQVNGVPRTAGVRTMGQFIGAVTNQSPMNTRVDALLGRWVRDYPIFADAFFGGQISRDHVQLLRRLENPRTCFELRGDQQFFVDAAIAVNSFDAFLKICERWQVSIDPDGKEPLDQLDKNAVSFRRGSGGRGKMIADLDAVSFAAAKQFIHAEADKLRTAAGVEAAPITDGQHRQAALMSLLTKGSQREDGTLPSPLANVVVTDKLAEWALIKLAGGDPGPMPFDPFDTETRCELIDGTTIHPFMAVAMTGLWKFDIPNLRRYVLNAESRIVDYSYNARIHPEHLRTASLIEHRGRCATTGCDAPFHWIRMDHITAHAKRGSTSLPNTQSLCQPDNQAKSDGPGFHKPTINWHQRRTRHRRKPDDPDPQS